MNDGDSAVDGSPERRTSSLRRPSFSSIRSRIRKPSFKGKRRSAASNDDDSLMVDDASDHKRWSINSEQSLPPLPPLPPRPTIVTAAPPLPERPLGHPREEQGPSSLAQPLVAEPHTLSPQAEPNEPPSTHRGQANGASGVQDVAKKVAQSAHGLASMVATRPAAQADVGPFQQHIPMIMTFFGATSLAVLVLSRLHWLLAAVVAGCASHVLWKKLDAAGRDAQWEVEMLEAAKRFHDPDQQEETVEWLNSTLATVWPLIGSDYFVPFVDLLEDSLMTQVPGIVHSVRVEDLDQGTIPIRVKSFKVIPSDEASFLAPEDEEGASSRSRKRRSRDQAEGNGNGTNLGSARPSDDDEDDDTGIDTGDYINLEVVFAYRGTKPSRRKRNKATTTTNDKSGSNEPIGADAEVDPAYQTLAEAPTEKIHMLIYMGIGLQKIAAVEVPVWVEMVGIEGKMRVRLQMTPVAPFVKHVALTFVGSPKLEMSAKPLGKKMIIDAMNLPLISSYALHSVEDVIKGFIAPKSYTVDVAGLLGSGDGPQDVYAMGLLVIVLHQATNLAAADANGYSDPFVQASFSHAGKPLFTSRVLRKTIDPIWQETAFLLVTPDELRDHERLRLTVFDADRFSADDPLGKVEVSIDGLIRRSRMRNEAAANLLETRMEDLKPMRRGTAVQGRLKFSVGFFALAQGKGTNLNGKRQEILRRAMARAEARSKAGKPVSLDFAAASPPPLPPKPGQKAETQEATASGSTAVSGAAVTPPPAGVDGGGSGSDENDDNELHQYMTPFDRFVHGLGLPMDDDVLRKRRDRKERVEKLITMIEGSKAATAEPPVRELPSGILAFHIHSIHNLEVQQTQRSYSNSKRLSQKQRYTTNADETLAEGTGAGKLPSSYVQVFLNDEAIFRTRTKTLNARPYINGGSERFVGDWTTARIDFTVRDARMREGDPILGCAGLRLADVLKKSSKSTEWYTLTGGLGYGKIRITLLWRSFESTIPKPLRGWNIGVLELARCRATGLSQQLFEAKPCHILFETVGGKVETANVDPIDEYESGGGEAAKVSYQWSLDKSPVRIPVRQRYPNFLYVNLRSESRVPGRHHKHAHAVVPLNRIADDTFTRRRVPLYETSDMDRFEQDMLRATTNADQLLSPTPGDDEPTRLSAALEEICEAGSRDLPLEVTSDHHIKCVGWLELNLIYHRGLGPEHGAHTAGDHELRFAYDTYVTLTDCGERPKSHSLSAESRKRLGEMGNRALEPSDGSAVPSMAGTPGSSRPGHRRVLSQPRNGADAFVAEPEERRSTEMFEDEEAAERGSLYTASVTDSEVEDYMSGEDADTPEGRRARQRALHRQHRGAAQVKGFRTLSWLKTNAEDGVVRVKRQFGKQNKRMGKMESEGVSHF